MKLKEKFDALIPIEFGGMQDPLLSNCVEVADEFAIGFAEWMNKTENRLGYHETKNEWYHFDSGKWITTKELLEIYKKEKGL